MYGDLNTPEIRLPDSRRVAPYQARPHVDLSYLKDMIGKHSYKLRDVLTNVHDVTLCEFRRDMCCCNAVFAAELYPSHSTADRSSIYHFFYGARWRFFWELCRQPAHTRCLYEVIPDGSLHNYYIDIDMDKPNRIFGGNDSPSGWPAMWLDMCKIVIPIVDEVVKRTLAECLVVDVAELATYCSVGVLPLTCSANGVYANLPNKWSAYGVEAWEQVSE